MKTLLSFVILIPLWAQQPAADPAARDAAPVSATAAAPAPSPAAQDQNKPVQERRMQEATKAAEPAAPLAAQATPAAQSAPTPATPAQSAPAQGAPAAPAAPAAQPAPAAPAQPRASSDNWLQGSIQLGYRWIPNISGSFNSYRSVVNLGEGPKLLDADFTLLNPSKRVFDRADIHTSSWGDPYNTLRADVTKDNSYRLTVDYRNIAYFDFLPSYADPTLNAGLLLNQNSFDTRIRTLDVQLDAHMNKWITPYIGFSQNTQFGRGITDFHTDANEYPVASLYSDQTYTYRAGVRMEMGRYHVTLEQGGTTFKDDQGASDSQTIPGNFTGSFLGQKLPLNSLSELYRVRGDSIYTKALLAANPYSWMSVTGQFIYAKPRTDINYTEDSAGTFYLRRILQFYSIGQDVLAGDANLPHVSGSLTVEIRPSNRLRLVEYWMTDRFHNASDALLAESFALAGSQLTDQQLLNDRLVLNTNREEVDAFYDLTRNLTVRGGYRYEWGNSDVRAPILTGLPFESANLRRQVGIAGVNYRIGQKFRITADAEGSSSDQTFFRTSLQDYQKTHIRARYDLSSEWRLAADFSLLNNSDPAQNVKLDYSSKIESASVFWTPKAAKWGNLLLDYSRSSLRSSVLYLVPQILQPTPSLYRENAHSLSAVAGVKWFSLGGSLFISSGSRPTQYYQPLARFTLPLQPHIQWITEWQWYSMAEVFYGFESFRSNQLTTSLRLSR
ncbi:MAG TPA: hypothetical protein VEV17_12175 [Bryobacteraceae bacterium]|nr:hypothetical protein [Bryobacteraceae bacterium]